MSPVPKQPRARLKLRQTACLVAHRKPKADCTALHCTALHSISISKSLSIRITFLTFCHFTAWGTNLPRIQFGKNPLISVGSALWDVVEQVGLSLVPLLLQTNLQNTAHLGSSKLCPHEHLFPWTRAQQQEMNIAATFCQSVQFCAEIFVRFFKRNFLGSIQCFIEQQSFGSNESS